MVKFTHSKGKINAGLTSGAILGAAIPIIATIATGGVAAALLPLAADAWDAADLTVANGDGEASRPSRSCRLARALVPFLALGVCDETSSRMDAVARLLLRTNA